MKLPDWKIQELAEAGMIAPFARENINPASYDLRLDGAWYDLVNNRTGNGMMRMYPGLCFLVSTIEYVKLPRDVGGMLVLKSSLGRRGVTMPCAGWVDPGFEGTLTIQLAAYVPTLLGPGDRFVQLVFEQLTGAADTGYHGRYQHQRGVTLDRPATYPMHEETFKLV